MSRPRKFDWDEARRLRAEGLTYAEIGRRLGVSDYAVKYACNAELREYAIRKQEGYRVLCDGCGERLVHPNRRSDGRALCAPCASLVRATSVRPDELRCVICREWKPDEEFPFNRGRRHARRDRHQHCRTCQTVLKREWRQRHPAMCERCGGPACPDSRERRARLCLPCYRRLRTGVKGQGVTVDELLATELVEA